MLNINKWLGRKPKEDEPIATEPAAKDYTRPEHFSYTAHDLMAEPEAVNAAFETANQKAHAGEPYGVALYMALREVSRNSQFLDDLVDELPNWAFAEHLPGAHMVHILLNWARATEQNEKSQHNCFRFWAILCGWRPWRCECDLARLSRWLDRYSPGRRGSFRPGALTRKSRHRAQ